MTWWEAVILGILQGTTEFLPISSSAHIRVLGPLLPSGVDPGAAFTAIIQIGSEIAVLCYFWRDITRIIRQWWLALRGTYGKTWRDRVGAQDADARMGWFVILGSIPIVIAGVLFKTQIETQLRNLYLTAIVLALFAIVLGLADRFGAKQREISDLSLKDALWLGGAQAVALIPGVSRSGGTISMGLALGLTRQAAARFSFLLAIPAVLGSGAYELFTSYHLVSGPGAPGLVATVIAAVVSFLVGYAVIVWFLKMLNHHSFWPFVIYRIAFAALIVVLLATQVLNPLG